MSLWNPKTWAMFQPKWKPVGDVDVRKSAGDNWIGRVTIEKKGHHRNYPSQHIFRRKPTSSEVIAKAKEECARRNSPGTPASFVLLEKGTGKLVSTIKGLWRDAYSFEVWDMRVEPQSEPSPQEQPQEASAT